MHSVISLLAPIEIRTTYPEAGSIAGMLNLCLTI
uniref:Uncharacterized protein n=1 Tax=Arundo donax TaxID=35708 RepID=A0A0A9G2J6_ARUDO